MEQRIGMPPLPAGMNFDDLENIKCDECGSEVWDQGSRLKKISAIVSEDGQEKVIILPVIVCMKCGKELPIAVG